MAYNAMRGIFSSSKENVTALACLTCDINSQVSLPTVFQNSCVSERLCMNKFNLTLPPEDKSLSHVSLEGTAKQLHVPLKFLEVLLHNVCFV